MMEWLIRKHYEKESLDWLPAGLPAVPKPKAARKSLIAGTVVFRARQRMNLFALPVRPTVVL